VQVLEEFMSETEAIMGMDLPMDVRRSHSWASRGGLGYLVRLDFVAPPKHLVNVTVIYILDVFLSMYVSAELFTSNL
jgi:hypothetical protein